jgi:hypothetical protein
MLFETLSIETTKDRFVTPSFLIPEAAQAASIYVPALDDASDIVLQTTLKPNRFNYYHDYIDYASDGILLEFDFDDPDGTTITDRVRNVTKLTEQGNPTFQKSAAVAGLGKGITFDGTGDQFDVLISELMPNQVITVGDFAVEMVFKLTNAANNSGADTLIAMRDGAAGVGFALQLDANEHLDAIIEDADGAVTMNTTTDVATGNIVYLGMDFDRSANCTAYINGAAVATAASIAAAEKSIYPGTSADARLSIGGDAARTAGNVITGTIYFTRIYNKVVGATGWANRYRALAGGLGYPGWSTLIDDVDGAAFILAASGEAPGEAPIPDRFLPLLKGRPCRIACLTQQTTTPSQLDFILNWR